MERHRSRWQEKANDRPTWRRLIKPCWTLERSQSNQVTAMTMILFWRSNHLQAFQDPRMSHHITIRITNERSDTPIPSSRWSLPRQETRLASPGREGPISFYNILAVLFEIVHCPWWSLHSKLFWCSTSALVLYFIQMYSANIYKWHKWVFHLGHLILPFLKNSIFTIKLFAFSNTLFLLRAWLPLMQFSNLYSSVWLKNRSYCCMRWLRE